MPGWKPWPGKYPGALLCYDGAPAAACYHSISAGHTEASQNVWLTALPYLQGVDSPWDKTVSDYEVAITYSAEQMASLLQGLGLTPGEGPGPVVRGGPVGRGRVCGYHGSLRNCLPGHHAAQCPVAAVGQLHGGLPGRRLHPDHPRATATGWD